MTDREQPSREEDIGGSNSYPRESLSAEPVNPYAAPPTMSAALRRPFPPVGSVLAQGFAIVSKNWMPLAVIVAVFWIPMEVVSQIADYELLGPVSDAASWAIVLAEFVVDSLCTPAILFVAIGAAAGKSITAVQAIGKATRVWLRFVLTYFLVAVVTSAGFIALVIPGLFLTVALSLTESVVVKENLSGFRAIGRSFHLAMQRFWPLAGICFVLLLLLMLLWVPFVALVFTKPELDTWQTSLAFGLAIDFLDIYPTICFYLAYRQLAEVED